MTEDEGHAECCQPDAVADGTVVRETAAHLEHAAARTRMFGLMLVTVGTLCVVAITAFTGYAAVQARNQSQFNERLHSIVLEYNEEHAKASGESFEAVNSSVRCMITWMADYNTALANALAHRPTPLPERGRLDACYRPTVPAPPPPAITEKKGPS